MCWRLWRRFLACSYFRIDSAVFGLSEASDMLPALHAAWASSTSDAAFVMAARGVWILVVGPVPVRGDWTS